MIKVSDLNDGNFVIFCMMSYDNPSGYTDSEFFSDVSRIKYIKKLLTRYKTGSDLKERLILNHLIVLSNVFGREALARIVWLKMEDHLEQIKPFMIALGLLPSVVRGVNGKDHLTDDVAMDEGIVDTLRRIGETS